MYEDLVTHSNDGEIRFVGLSPRQIVWLEVYKANTMAGSEYPLLDADDALRHYEQLFNGAE